MPAWPLAYFTPRTSRSRSATIAVLVLTLSIPLAFVAAVLLRWRQLSLPDPYNNSFAVWSTLCLMSAPALTFADAILVLRWRRRLALPVLIGALVILGLAGLYIVMFVAQMLWFLFP